MSPREMATGTSLRGLLNAEFIPGVQRVRWWTAARCGGLVHAHPMTYTGGGERYHGEPTAEQPRQRTQAAMWGPPRAAATADPVTENGARRSDPALPRSPP